jgi:tetratricopeptide (TPR) repeat protein
MPTLLCCPNGHRWRPTAHATTRCPVCGDRPTAPSDTTQDTLPETDPSVGPPASSRTWEAPASAPAGDSTELPRTDPPTATTDTHPDPASQPEPATQQSEGTDEWAPGERPTWVESPGPSVGDRPETHVLPEPPPTDRESAPPATLSDEELVASVSPSLQPTRAMPGRAGRSGGPVPAPPGYQILGELGRGGMGVVYKARQVGLNRVVALKMILAGGHAGAHDLARFRAEAEAVARLQHPNIVQIYEVGEHEGRPYFSLEYVDGGNLAHHIDGQPQPPRRAAEVLKALAEAMDCAHRAGILHRDLKPANVLMAPGRDAPVVGAGAERPPLAGWVPKVTDFGLAKRLEEEAGQTREGAILGTPSYMAPEQAAGKVRELGPAVDIYALGAVLYDLLTGGPPFRGSTVMDTLQQVLHQEPVPPARVTAKVPRDLETICLKCLEKEPKKRYASAAALADDLGRFLSDRPILARPTPAWERAYKWARRRPAQAALALVISLSLLALGGGGLAYAHHADRLRRAADNSAEKARAAESDSRAKRREAEANFRRACAAVDDLLERIGKQRLAHEPRQERLRRDLLEQALAFYRQFLDERGDDPLVRWRTGVALRNAADVEGLLGKQAEAERHYERALELLGGLAKEFPDDASYRRDLALARYRLGLLLAQGQRLAQAEEAYRAARDLQRQLVAEAPREPGPLQELAATTHALGLLLRQRNQNGEAEEAYRESILLCERLLADFPPRPAYRQELARALNKLGELEAALGRADEAGRSYRAARDRLLELTREAPDNPEYQEELALTHDQFGQLLRDSDPKEAEAEYREALRLSEKLVADYPATPTYRQELATTLNNLGVLLQAAGRRAPAEEAFNRALAIKDRLAAGVPWVPELRLNLAGSLNNRGIQLLTENRLAEAASAYGRAVELLRALHAEHKDTPAYEQELARTLLNKAILRQAQRKPADAEKLYAEALTTQQGLADRFPKVPEYSYELARTYLNRGALLQTNGKPDGAEKSYHKGLDLLAELAPRHPENPDYPHQQALGRLNLGNLLRDRKRPAEAEPLWREARDALAALAGKYPEVPGYKQALGHALNEWAVYLMTAKRANEAEKAFDQARDIQEGLVRRHGREPAYREELARTEGNLGLLEATRNRLDKAEEHYRAAITTLEGLDAPGTRAPAYREQLAMHYNNLATLLNATGPSAETEKAWRRLVEVRRQLADDFPGETSYQTELARAEHLLAAHLSEHGGAKEARTLLESAVRHQQAALKAAPTAANRQALVLHYARLIELLLRQRDHAAAAAALAGLLEQVPADWPKHAQAAAHLAKCAALAREDKNLSEAERRRLAGEYADRAMRQLQDAVRHGFKDRDYLQKTEDFDVLRDRPDFKALLDTLGG